MRMCVVAISLNTCTQTTVFHGALFSGYVEEISLASYVSFFEKSMQADMKQNYPEWGEEEKEEEEVRVRNFLHETHDVAESGWKSRIYGSSCS